MCVYTPRHGVNTLYICRYMLISIYYTRRTHPRGTNRPGSGVSLPRRRCRHPQPPTHPSVYIGTYTPRARSIIIYIGIYIPYRVCRALLLYIQGDSPSTCSPPVFLFNNEFILILIFGIFEYYLLKNHIFKFSRFFVLLI